jgi:hypothetical protein
MRAQSDIARLSILLSRRMSGQRPKMPSCFSCMHNWVASGCRWANNFSAAVWAVETGLHGALPVYLSMLDGIARWRLLERKRSPAIREVTPTELPLSRLHQTSARSESLQATDPSSSWPMFDPSQYWPPQASLDFLTPSPVEQLQVQQSSNSPRATIPIPPSEGGGFRATPSMISTYRYPAFDPVFTALDQAQGLSYDETSEMPMHTDILELQTNITSDLDTRSDSGSASAVQCDVEMNPTLTNQLSVCIPEGAANNLNECPLEDPEGAMSDYDNRRLHSPTLGDLPPEPASRSPVTTSPVEHSSQQIQSMESSAVDRRLPRLSSTLATSSE